jgi:ribosomal subunit interface protein
MHLEVTFRNVKPREEIRRRGQALFAKLERFLDPSSEATLIIAAEHGVTSTDLTVSSRGQIFQAHEEDEDLRTSLDRTFHRVEHALRRAKERRVDRWQRGAEAPDGFEAAGDGADEDDAEQPALS